MTKHIATALAFLLITACNNGSSVSGTPAQNSADAALDGTTDPQTPDGTACANPVTTGQPFAVASGDQSDPVFTPMASIDGCADTASSWSGNGGEQLVLDSGSQQAIQGIYLWMSYRQPEWLMIEQSIDGESWQTSWRRVHAATAAGSTYFSLDDTQATRFLRITGYGSDTNAWTNIAEARWSLTGEAIVGERAWQYSPNLLALHDGAERAASPQYQQTLARMFISCPYLGDPLYIDATGTLDNFWQVEDIDNVLVYSFDWQQYPASEEFDIFAAPAVTYEPMRHAQALLEPLAAEDPLLLQASDCSSSTVLDALHLTDEMLQQAKLGLLGSSVWN